MLRVTRKFKNYQNRQIRIYDGKKLVDILVPWHGWYLNSYVVKEELDDEIRLIAMQNLYWLLGKDSNEENWNNLIELWDKGQGVFKVKLGKKSKSLFKTSKLKEIASNSFEI